MLNNSNIMVLAMEIMIAKGSDIVITNRQKEILKVIVEEYIKRVNPYEKQRPLEFDLRKYAAYVKEKGLKVSDITPEIMNMFVIEHKGV